MTKVINEIGVETKNLGVMQEIDFSHKLINFEEQSKNKDKHEETVDEIDHLA